MRKTPTEERKGLLRGGLALLAGILLFAAAMAAPAVLAQDNATEANATQEGDVVELNIETYDNVQENAYWFEFERVGVDARNPTVYLPPGSHVVAHVSNVGEVVHNFHVDPQVVQNCTVEDCATELLDPGAETTIEFDVPADAPQTFEYWCDPHLGLGMVGNFTTDQSLATGQVPAPGAGQEANVTGNVTEDNVTGDNVTAEENVTDGNETEDNATQDNVTDDNLTDVEEPEAPEQPEAAEDDAVPGLTAIAAVAALGAAFLIFRRVR